MRDVPDWVELVAIVAGSVVLLWLVMLALLWRARPDDVTLRDAVRLVPDVLRLLKRLAGDRTLPRGVRMRLWLLLGYLAMPFDLVPDFIPVLGYADDVVVVAFVLRSVVRAAGPEALERHWPGTPEGLRVIRTLCGRRGRGRVFP
ncbi:MAG: hypothetical protein QOH68_2928 [Nocardioidaceae bacterium]|jgi:uncharacterized membrane protein YkvA (DUF1232 family)|nr:hypothetical protein [Nocardioidaceae bacterium]